MVEFASGEQETGEDQIRLLLEEARFVFSGMVYGFRFRYVPSDRARAVVEEFDLVPLHQIAWGDPALSVVESRFEAGRRYALIRYWVAEEQQSWSRFWQSNVHAPASAFGSSDLFGGRSAKLEAIEEGVIESVRAFLRPREQNKPKEISGRVAFADVPYVVISGGEYHARVEVKLDIQEVIPYRIF